MNTAKQIRSAIAQVFELRQLSRSDPSIAAATRAVKRFQSRRFSMTYQDLLISGRFKPAAEFFLTELYGDRNYERRDTQFGRIAGAIQKLLPESTQGTAVALAQLHLKTEYFDHSMGLKLATDNIQAEPTLDQYVAAWRLVGQRADRQEQLSLVLDLGQKLAGQIHVPGLQTLLHAMRIPAAAAGLAETQKFLQSGFDAFRALERQDSGATEFLSHIRQRETDVIKALFDGDPREWQNAIDPSTRSGRSTQQINVGTK